MDKVYTSVESRLCSEGCSDSYWKHVMGDKTAALGTGKRFMLWLQSNQREVYASLAEAKQEQSKLGRPTKNGHTMNSAERMRELRARRGADFRHILQIDIIARVQNPKM